MPLIVTFKHTHIYCMYVINIFLSSLEDSIWVEQHIYRPLSSFHNITHRISDGEHKLHSAEPVCSPAFVLFVVCRWNDSSGLLSLQLADLFSAVVNWHLCIKVVVSLQITDIFLQRKNNEPRSMWVQRLFSCDRVRIQMKVPWVGCGACEGCCYRVIVPSQSKTVEEHQRMAGLSRGICFSAICSTPPLSLPLANCCISPTFHLRNHMHGHKLTADTFGHKSPPSFVCLTPPPPAPPPPLAPAPPLTKIWQSALPIICHFQWTYSPFD